MADASTLMRIACVQMRSGLDRPAITRDALALISEAAGQGATFIATPEMTNIVDRKPKRLLETLPSESDLEEVTAFGDAAREHKVWLLIGSVAAKAPGVSKAVNRSLLFAPTGDIVARYDKIHMFDVDLPDGETWKESAVYQPGDKAVLVDASAGRIGLTVCYDVRFPHLYRQLAQAGALLFVVPAAFTAQTGRAHWRTLLCSRAIENGAFVAAPAQGGRHEDGRDTYGHSMIIGPWGEIIAELDHDDPGVLVADIDFERAREARSRIPNLGLDADFKITILNQ
ncbi:MAG: carbon-nitrogen hydrolase family protein [Pseudomonadota bacterium]